MRLKKVATELREWNYRAGKAIPDADEWLDANDLLYVLRRRGVKHDHRLAHDESGRKLRDHYLPHIPIDAQVWARTWKVLNAVKKVTGRGSAYNWEHFILPLLEREILKGVRK